MNDSFRQSLRDRARAIAIGPPPDPWREVARVAVGGLEGVGFAQGSDLLLVLSSRGRGMFDAGSAERIARDCNEAEADWQRLEAEGIGPLQGQIVRMAGIGGGGLTTSTHDGWRVELAAPDWPEQDVFLVEPYSMLFDPRPGRAGKAHKLISASALIACGFSPSGRCFIVATSSDIAFFARSSA